MKLRSGGNLCCLYAYKQNRPDIGQAQRGWFYTVIRYPIRGDTYRRIPRHYQLVRI